MKLSIVTSVLNGVMTIRTALESIRRQSLPSGVVLEYIVVDGASTDGMLDVIREFEASLDPSNASFVFRWISEKDRGLYDAINKGIRMVTGDVVGICNADDVLAEEDTIAKIVAAFELDPSLDGLYADIRFVQDGDSVDALRGALVTRYCTGRFFRNWMFRFATCPAHPSMFVRPSCFAKYGYYALDYKICADFEMMLRLMWKHRIRTRYLPACTHVMRTGGLSTGGIRSNIRINREDLRALRANGYWSCMPLIYSKYLFKVWGFVFCKWLAFKT